MGCRRPSRWCSLTAAARDALTAAATIPIVASTTDGSCQRPRRIPDRRRSHSPGFPANMIVTDRACDDMPRIEAFLHPAAVSKGRTGSPTRFESRQPAHRRNRLAICGTRGYNKPYLIGSRRRSCSLTRTLLRGRPRRFAGVVARNLNTSQELRPVLCELLTD